MKASDGASKFSMMDFFESVRQGKWIIVITFLVVTLTVFTVTKLMAPLYESNAIVYVDTQRSTAPFTQGVGLEDRGLHNELGILQYSFPLAERVAERLLDLRDQVERKEQLPVIADLGEGAQASAVAWQLVNQTRFSLVSQNMNMVRISATSQSPQEAALIANLYAQEYENRSREASRATISATRAFLEEQERRGRADVAEIEREYEAFMKQRGVVMLGADGENLVSQAALVDAQRGQALIDLEMERNHLRSIEAELNRLRPGMSERMASTVGAQVTSLAAKAADLTAQIEEYYARDPSLRGREQREERLADLLRRRSNFEEQIRRVSDKLVEDAFTDGAGFGATEAGQTLAIVGDLQRQTIERNIAINKLEALVRELDARQREFDTRLASIPGQQVQLAQLQRERESVVRLHSMLVDKLQETVIAEESELGYVEIIRNAGIPSFPVRPRVTENMTLGMLLGLLFGLGLAFLRRAMSQSVYKPEDLLDEGHNLIGIIPNVDKAVRQVFKGKKHVQMDGKEVSTKLLPLHDPWSPIAEAYRYIRTNIQFARPDKIVQTVMVTSPSASEGKTLTAVNLAITLSQGGRKTLLVDADMRQPTAYAQLGLKAKPGLADFVNHGASLDFSQFKTDIDNLYMLPPGDAVESPAELMGSKAMREFVAAARDSFDSIVFDVPPILPVADAVLLSTQCDATIMVTAAGLTDLRALDQALGALDTVGASVIGVVLNRFDGKSTYGYGYGYGHGYGQQYGADRGRKIAAAVQQRRTEESR